MECSNKCGGYTDVLETIQRGPLQTRRRRRCLTCGHRFTTIETTVEAHRKSAGFDLVDELKRLSKGRRNFDAEAVAAAISVDRRKREIAERQRRERYDDDDATPRQLNRFAARRELRGY